MPAVSTKEVTKQGGSLPFSHRARKSPKSLPHQNLQVTLGIESIKHALGLFQKTKSKNKQKSKSTLHKINVLRQTR